ncbi:MAG: [LysW]-aminoadipate kinase [Planctomycetota bacterium]|jgi:acetylglutamate/LysW-gamma-L-alpha-aminoadipate kinase
MMLVKIGGGAAMNLEAIAADIACLSGPLVVVHGANSLRNRLAEDLGIQVRTVTSLSGYDSVLSDEDTIDLLMLTYAGLRNKRLVELLQQKGVNAIGLTGVDGGLIRARRNKGIRTMQDGKKMLLRDLSGKPERLDGPLMTWLLENGYVPVLTVPVLDEHSCAVNTENDEIVALLARELEVDEVIQLIEAPGLLQNRDDPDSLFHVLTPLDLEAWESDAQGRMKRKVRSLVKLFQNGSPKVYVGDGRVENPIQRLMAGEGTIIR